MSCGQGVFVVSVVLVWVLFMAALRKRPTREQPDRPPLLKRPIAEVLFQCSPCNDNRERYAFGLLCAAGYKGPDLVETLGLIAGLTIAFVLFELLFPEGSDKEL